VESRFACFYLTRQLEWKLRKFQLAEVVLVVSKPHVFNLTGQLVSTPPECSTLAATDHPRYVAFDFGGFELPGGSLFSFGSYENEYDDASFSFSVESYVGCAIEIVVATRSVVQTASFAKRVSESPVGIVNF